MIRSLHIENFKCFRRCDFEIRPLTLLAGFNGSGKSSFLQAFLLMRQAFEGDGKHVRLNGPYFLRLGQTTDVLHHDPTSRTIHLVAESTSGGRRCSFDASDDPEGLTLAINDRQPKSGVKDDGEDLLAALFNYLNAERLGPRDFMELDTKPTQRLAVGPRGEFVAHVLNEHERHTVSPGRLHPDSKGTPLLRQQVELWMRSTSPDLEILPNRLPDMGLATLRFKRRGAVQDWHRPPNTGFGISYSLPIVVAGLLAPKDTLFIVENPEAHLHPAGQSSLGGFLAKIASDGVQVIVETHSDHVLNGIRLATVAEGSLQHNQAIVHYFHEGPTRATVSTPIEVDPRGGLTHWPQGFFDQSEQDLAKILRARKKR